MLVSAQADLPLLAMRATVARDIRTAFDSPDLSRTEARLAELVEEYRKPTPNLAAWMEGNIAQGLAVLALREHFRRRLRTFHMCERVNREIKRRTRVAGLIPHEPSVLRLVTAILIETSEEWETGRANLTEQPRA